MKTLYKDEQIDHYFAVLFLGAGHICLFFLANTKRRVVNPRIVFSHIDDILYVHIQSKLGGTGRF